MNIFIYPLLAFIFFFSTCTKSDENEEACVDEDLINELAVCYLIYAPVCGCNKINYSNDCIANSNGVYNYTEGECK